MQNDYYDRYWSEGYKHTGQRQGYAPNFLRWMERELAPATGDPRRHRGLEAGCGDASFTGAFARFHAETHAIDISPTQIEENQKHHPGVLFRAHDLGVKLPYPDDHFETVWCSEVLEHLFDPLFALREFQRVLRPGGSLLVTVPYHGPFKNVLIALFKWEHHFDPEYPHLRFFTDRSLGTIARKAGFSEVKFTTCGMSKPLRDFLIPTNLLMRATKSRPPAPSARSHAHLLPPHR